MRTLTDLQSVHEPAQGDRLDLVLSWGRFHRHHRFDVGVTLGETAEAWRRWMTNFRYGGPQEAMVRRAAITLKLCDHWVDGSLAAAPTSPLPAPVGGVRNWDYRCAWIRDAAFAVFALRRIGFANEADAFPGWVLHAFEQSRSPRIMYTLAGGPVPEEWVDTELAWYRNSAPVRWGNGAVDQRQHDVYGEVLDCADQWVRGGGQLEPTLWTGLAGLADTAERTWRQPDQGIWEIRSLGRVFTYSADLCHVALDRAAAIAERIGLPGPVAKWRSAAATIRTAILEASRTRRPRRCASTSAGAEWTPACWRCPYARSCPPIIPAWWPPPGPSPTASARAAACSTATGMTTRRGAIVWRISVPGAIDPRQKGRDPPRFLPFPPTTAR